MTMYPTESTIILGILGSLGVIATAIIYLYGANRNQRLELKLARRVKAARELDVVDLEFLD